jgi:hypothetical protein
LREILQENDALAAETASKKNENSAGNESRPWS